MWRVYLYSKIEKPQLPKFINSADRLHKTYNIPLNRTTKHDQKKMYNIFSIYKFPHMYMSRLQTMIIVDWPKQASMFIRDTHNYVDLVDCLKCMVSNWIHSIQCNLKTHIRFIYLNAKASQQRIHLDMYALNYINRFVR